MSSEALTREPEVSWKGAEGFALDAIHFAARPLHPLDISYAVDTIAPGSSSGFDEWSLPMSCVRNVAVNGWVYTRVEPFGNPPKALMRFQFLAHLWRIVPPLRKRILGFDRFLADGGFAGQLRTWDDVWRPEAERRIAEVRRLDLAIATRAQIADHLLAWHDFMTWQWSPHIRIHLICFFVRGKFAEVCERLLGLTDLEAYELIKRSDPFLLEGPRKLADMAKRARTDADVAQALVASPEEALEALRDTWFERDLADFLDSHGDIPIDGFTTSLPTWRELPHRVVALVQRFLNSDYDPDADEATFQQQRKQRIDDLRARLAGDDLTEFDRWLQLGEQAYPLNDIHNHLLLEYPVAYIRQAALRAGDLLVADREVDDRSDVFFLQLDELTSALRNPGDQRSLVAQRRATFLRQQTLDRPVIVGDPSPLPPTHVFPPRVDEAMRILLAQAEKMSGSEIIHARSESALTGVAGSPGIAEGRVCIASDVDELDKVQDGDVLVCPITGPAWTVVFPMISALVTEAGGPLSHPAIVAREFGIPSVVGTGSATRVLRDGQRVRVDGSNASVTVIG